MYLFFLFTGKYEKWPAVLPMHFDMKKNASVLWNCSLMVLILYKDVVSIPFFVFVVLGSVAEPDERFVDFDLISCIELYVITFIKFSSFLFAH